MTTRNSFWRAYAKPIFVIAFWEIIQRIRNPFQIIVFVISTTLTSFVVLSNLQLYETSDTKEIWIGIDCQSNQSLLIPILNTINESFTLHNGNPKFILVPVSPSEQFDSSLVSAFITVSLKSDKTSTLHITLFNETALPEVQTVRYVIESVLHEQMRDSNHITTSIQKSGQNPSKAAPIQSAMNLAFAIIVFTVSMGSGQLLLRSFLEERQTSLFDVLLTSTRSQSYLFGKYLGNFMYGALQITLWVMLLMVILRSYNVYSITTTMIIDTVVYSVLAMAMNLILFLIAGIYIRKEVTANAVTYILSLVILVPLAFSSLTISQSNQPFMQVVSFIPIFTPTMLFYNVTTNPLGENTFPQSALMISSFILMLYLANKAFQQQRVS